MPTSTPIRDLTRDAIERAWQRAVTAGALPAPPDDPARPAVEVERPAEAEHGDLATNLAMKLARPYRMAPLAIATHPGGRAGRRGETSPTTTPIQRARSRRPASSTCAWRIARSRTSIAAVLADPAGWGRRRDPRTAAAVNVEFVSANPTGPLTIGNARGAFIGDLLCRVLEAGGQRVTREYYFNDSGGQIGNLGASVAALRRGEPVPEDGYQRRLRGGPRSRTSRTTSGPRRPRPAPTRPRVVGHWAAGRVREGIEASLDRARRPRSTSGRARARLHDEGWVERAVERLRAGGHVYEQDGAMWFRSTAFGDDKDRVIIRSNGEPTYFAADIGYVTEKFSRGFDHLIYIWGADHHGTVARVRNAAEAMGYDRDAVQMLLYSWVRFVRDGVEVSMSKRAGEFITLDELLAEVGVDAARWFFASRGATTAHRLRHRAGEEAVEREPGLLRPVRPRPDRLDPAQGGRRRADAGGRRRRWLWPGRPKARWRGRSRGSRRSSRTRSPPRRPRASRPTRPSSRRRSTRSIATRGWSIPRQPERSAARLALARAAQVTLANALGLLGISAPESM